MVAYMRKEKKNRLEDIALIFWVMDLGTDKSFI